MELIVNLEIIKKYMDEQNVSQREMARRMKISNSYLVRIINGERKPGMKFVQGLFKLGYGTKDVFIKKKSQKKIIDNKNIIQYVFDYMNTMAMPYGQVYKLEEVKKIKRSIDMEKSDRQKKKLNIKGNTAKGRDAINERAAIIAREIFKLDFTARDIQLYKKCSQMEAKERYLINSMEEDEVS